MQGDNKEKDNEVDNLKKCNLIMVQVELDGYIVDQINGGGNPRTRTSVLVSMPIVECSQAEFPPPSTPKQRRFPLHYVSPP